MGYVSLHTHTWYSHDGKDSPEDIAAYCVKNNQSACGLTDHGTLAAVVDFAQACVKYNIKGVLGCEIYYQPVFDKVLPRYHMTVLCQNRQGYSNLCQMVSRASREHFYYYPVVTDDDIRDFQEGLLFGSGCISSFVSRQILEDNSSAALEHIQWMRRLVGDRYYLEVQPFPVWKDEETFTQEVLFSDGETSHMPILQKVDIQQCVNKVLHSWSQNYNIPAIMTSDSHYTDKDQFGAFRDSHKLRKKQDLITDYSMRYMHTEQSMLHAWVQQMGSTTRDAGMQYIDETGVLADRCTALLTEPIPIQMPELSWVTDPLAQLTRMVAVGMKKYGAEKQTERYKDRVKYELRLIRDKEYLGYFHIVGDFFAWCQQEKIFAQVRGSAVASLIAYFLGWHDIDPLVHKLPFNRFLSEVRTDQPDIDIDVNDHYRDRCLAYLTEKYKGHSAQISTFNRWDTRSLIVALCKVYNVPVQDAQRIKYAILGMFSGGMKMSYMNVMAYSPECSQAELNHPGLFKSFFQLYGGISSIGTHAAGVALSHGPIDQRIAIQKSHGTLQTAVAKEQCVYLGITKLDVLGVRNLAVVQEALQHAGVAWSETYYNDPVIYSEFTNGRTRGIFQFDRSKAIQMCKDARPTCLADIAVITACNRPGPLIEGTWDKWMKFRKNPVRPSGAPAWWDEHTGDTFVFQENVMAVCQEAGFTPAQIDKMLKMLKKYQEETELTRELRTLFVDNMMHTWKAQRKHISPKATEAQQAQYTQLFESMRRYLFNKAHAWSYAGLAAKEVWLRYYHKRSWYLALLRNESDKNLRLVFSAEAVKAGVYVVPPHVNGAIAYEEIVINNKPYIQEGLLALHGLGEKCAQAIVEERHKQGAFTSRENFLHRFGFVELGDVATKTVVIRHYKPSEVKKITKQYGDVFAKGVNITAIAALDACGALEFDHYQLKQHIVRYNKQLAAHKEESRWHG